MEIISEKENKRSMGDAIAKNKIVNRNVIAETKGSP
jgi:hypothetical protein